MNDKPVILVEVFFLQDQYFRRGIGRYGIEIAKRLLQLDRSQYRVLGVGLGEEGDSLKRLGLNPNQVKFDHFYSLGVPKDSSPVSNLILYHQKLRPLVQMLAPDVYIASHFERGLPSDLCPVTVPIHDVIPLATGHYSKQGPIINLLKGTYYRMTFEKVHNCAAIFTSSEYSKQDLIKIGHLPEPKIHTIYLGVSEVFNKDSIHIPDLGALARKYFGSDHIPDYIIYDGGFEQNKNTDQLIEVWAELKTKLPQLKLVVTGGDFLIDVRNSHQTSYTPVNERSKEFVDTLTEFGILEDLVPVGRLGEHDMAVLTKLAKGYINLSRYEGFGFGPLQAMAAGTPAIVAKSTSFIEVAGPAALLIDLDDWKKQIPQVVDLLTDTPARAHAISAGLEHAKLYNWDNTFNQTWSVIKQVASI